MRHPRSVTEQQPVRDQLERQATASSDDRKVRRIYLALAGASLCACLFLDLIYFPIGTIFPDEKRFLTSATRMVETGNFAVGSNRAWEMPGTATFFAAFVWLFSSGDAAVLPIRVAQAFLVLFQAILVGNAARRIFNDRIISLVAFTMMAFYPFLLYFQGLLLSETLFNTFFIAAVCFLYWWRDRGLRIDGALLLACICFLLSNLHKGDADDIAALSRRSGHIARARLAADRSQLFSYPRSSISPRSRPGGCAITTYCKPLFRLPLAQPKTSILVTIRAILLQVSTGPRIPTLRW